MLSVLGAGGNNGTVGLGNGVGGRGAAGAAPPRLTKGGAASNIIYLARLPAS